MKSKTRSMAVCAALAGTMMSLAAGCGEPGEEEVEVIRGGLSFGAWQTLTGKNFDESGPSLLTKKQGNGTTGQVWWAMVSPPDHKLWRDVNSSNSFLGWGEFVTTTNVSLPTASVSWMGPNGVGESLNAALAWVDNGAVKVGVSQSGFGALSGIVSLGATSTAPGLAFANNFLYVFIKDSSNQIRFKRCPVTTISYNSANWSANWTTIPAPTGGLAGGSFSSGPSAAQITSNTMMVMAAAGDQSNSCIAANLVANANSTSVGAWHVLIGCQMMGGSKPALAPIGPGGTGSGARIVVRATGGDVLFTGTTTDGFNTNTTEVPMGTCTNIAEPALTQHMYTGQMVLATVCSGSTDMRWRTITP